jgi:hypothetical protein
MIASRQPARRRCPERRGRYSQRHCGRHRRGDGRSVPRRPDGDLPCREAGASAGAGPRSSPAGLGGRHRAGRRATAAARIDTDGPELIANVAAPLLAGLGQRPGWAQIQQGTCAGASPEGWKGTVPRGWRRVARCAPGQGWSRSPCRASALLAHASRGPDALMLRTCDGAEAVAALLADRRRTAVVIGPAYGVGEAHARCWSLLRLAAAGRGARCGCADQLCRGSVEALAELTRISGRAVLTPHQGEFDRLFPEEASNSAESTGVRARSVARSRLPRACRGQSGSGRR